MPLALINRDQAFLADRILKTLPPQSGQVPERAGRPLAMVTSLAPAISTFFLSLRQYPSAMIDVPFRARASFRFCAQLGRNSSLLAFGGPASTVKQIPKDASFIPVCGYFEAKTNGWWFRTWRS